MIYLKKKMNDFLRNHFINISYNFITSKKIGIEQNFMNSDKLSIIFLVFEVLFQFKIDIVAQFTYNAILFTAT